MTDSTAPSGREEFRVVLRGYDREQVDDFRLVEVNRFSIVTVGMFQFDAVEADTDLYGILDRRITDAQVQKARSARIARTARITRRWRRLIVDSIVNSAARSAAGGQSKRKDAYQSKTGAFHKSIHLSFPHDMIF